MIAHATFDRVGEGLLALLDECESGRRLAGSLPKRHARAQAPPSDEDVDRVFQKWRR